MLRKHLAWYRNYAAGDRCMEERQHDNRIQHTTTARLYPQIRKKIGPNTVRAQARTMQPLDRLFCPGTWRIGPEETLVRWTVQTRRHLQKKLLTSVLEANT